MSNGDFGRASGEAGLPSAVVASSSDFGITASMEEMILEPRGVDVADDGPPSITELGIACTGSGEGGAGGRGVVSGASSKLSWNPVSLNLL